jgi:peptidoglycan hydrolase-like protein with peptidoglycan-binding domain
MPAPPGGGYLADAGPSIVIPASGPDRDARRRGAMMAIGGVVLATVVVVLATVIIGPRLSSSGSGPTGNVAPPVSPTGAPNSASDLPSTTSSAASSSAAGDPTTAATASSTAVASRATTVTGGSTATTVTTASQTGARSGVSSVTVGSGAGSGQATTTSSRSAPPVVVSTIQSTTPTTSAADLGVPVREITCSNGMIVQLASEMTPAAFQARVSALRSQGLVPGDAAAATTSGSCPIFANQQNTYVLYSGPFGGLGDACRDRLSGPYDAYVKGANPGSAATFYSCICPVGPNRLPDIRRTGQTGQWVGELQRMLGHLRYGVGSLNNSTWGVYTAATRAAVQRFQSDHHLRPDGVVNAKTWAAIKSAGCS